MLYLGSIEREVALDEIFVTGDPHTRACPQIIT